MSRRAQHRRAQREADRRCATAADFERLDRQFRRLPDDFPSFVRAVDKASRAGKQLTRAQIDELLDDVIEVSWDKAAPILCRIRKSREFRRWERHLGAHPGPQSKLRPEILILAMVVAVEKRSRVHRTVVCQIVNGMDSRIWHSAGMCSHHSRTPVSFNVVARQLLRVEGLPQTARTPLRLP